MVSCTVTADGGPSGLGRDARGRRRRHRRGGQRRRGDGQRRRRPHAPPRRRRRRGQQPPRPRRRLRRPHRAGAPRCPAPPPTAEYTCRADASDGTSGLAALGWSLDGGAYADDRRRRHASPSPRARSRLRAVDVAGNETSPIRSRWPRSRSTVQGADLERPGLPQGPQGRGQHGRRAARRPQRRPAPCRSTCGRWPSAAAATASRSGSSPASTPSDVKRTYKVGRTGALPRISASLSKATEKTTVTLTVRKKSGTHWRKLRRHAQLVLAKYAQGRAAAADHPGESMKVLPSHIAETAAARCARSDAHLPARSRPPSRREHRDQGRDHAAEGRGDAGRRGPRLRRDHQGRPRRHVRQHERQRPPRRRRSSSRTGTARSTTSTGPARTVSWWASTCRRPTRLADDDADRHGRQGRQDGHVGPQAAQEREDRAGRGPRLRRDHLRRARGHVHQHERQQAPRRRLRAGEQGRRRVPHLRHRRRPRGHRDQAAPTTRTTSSPHGAPKRAA